MKTRFAKKCASIGLAVVMVCSLAGCGGGTRTENEDRKDALSYEDAQAELSSLRYFCTRLLDHPGSLSSPFSSSSSCTFVTS